MLVCLVGAGCTFGSDGGGSGEGGADGTSTGTSVGDTDPPLTSTTGDGSGGATGTSTDPDSTGGTSTGPGVNPTEGTTTDEPPGTGTGTGADTGTDTEGSSTTAVAMCTTDPWYDPGWSARRRLDIDNTGFDGSLSGFPALLRLTPAVIDYDAMANDGSDLRIVADDHATELPYEIEQWVDGGSSFVWVRVPSIPDEGSTPPSLYMYYGNPGATPGQNAAGVWDDDFVSVHHFADFTDATGDGHDGMGANLPAIAAGPTGPSGQFDGVDDRVELPMALESDYDFMSAFTVSTLIRVDAFTIGWQAIVTKGDDAWRMHRHANTSTVGFGTDFGGNDNTAGTTPIDDGAWYHVTIIMDGFTKRIFVDAALDVQDFESATETSNSPVWFGDNADQQGRFFHGGLDEIRISSVARSDTWIDAESRDLIDGTLIAFGAEEPCEP